MRCEAAKGGTDAGGRRPPARRIMIVGQPGSGKSTLAAALGERSGLPVIHIDKIHWQPGWRERSKAEKTRLCLAAEQGERWILRAVIPRRGRAASHAPTC